MVNHGEIEHLKIKVKAVESNLSSNTNYIVHHPWINPTWPVSREANCMDMSSLQEPLNDTKSDILALLFIVLHTSFTCTNRSWNWFDRQGLAGRGDTVIFSIILRFTWNNPSIKKIYLLFVYLIKNVVFIMFTLSAKTTSWQKLFRSDYITQ